MTAAGSRSDEVDGIAYPTEGYAPLNRCLAFLCQHAASSSAPSSSSNTAGSQVPAVVVPKATMAALRRFHHQGDEWVVMECGEWLEHPLGWRGPALALFQVRLLQLTERETFWVAVGLLVFTFTAQ